MIFVFFKKLLLSPKCMRSGFRPGLHLESLQRSLRTIVGRE